MFEIQKIDHSPATESSVETPLFSTIGPPTSVSHKKWKSMITLDSRPHQRTHFNFQKKRVWANLCLRNSYGTAIFSFVKTGFSDWKKATKNGKGFSKHENLTFHKNATSMLGTALTTKDIAEQLSSQHEAEKLTRRKNLLKILSSVRYLARQGLPLRGDGDGPIFIDFLLLVAKTIRSYFVGLSKNMDGSTPHMKCKTRC